MAFSLKPLDGPLLGQIFKLQKGFTLGRSTGDLVIDDGRMSSRHALVEEDETGALYLTDLGSKNGLRVKGDRIDRVALSHGLKILIGSYTYEIIDDSPALEVTRAVPISELKNEPEPPAPSIASAKPKPKPKPKIWNQVLAQFARANLREISNEVRPVAPLVPAVVLDFIRGSQLDTHWVLGYGPRRVGAGSMDLPVYEPEAPDVCFEIFPTQKGISFKTQHPETVLLNGSSVKTALLKTGDIIKIHDTEIEVGFTE